MDLGFIGTGFMGGPMALHLVQAKHRVAVHDVKKDAVAEVVKAGAVWAESPKAAAHGAEIVLTSLPGPAQVEQVVYGPNGLMGAMRRGATYIDLSSNSPTLIRRIEADFKKQGVNVLDAPVSGGAEGAEAATLAVWAGGNEELYLRVKPVLDVIGNKAMYCGPIGAGMICKITNNLIAMSILALLPEAFAMAVKAGVPAQTVYEAVSKGSGNTELMHLWRTMGLRQGARPPKASPGMSKKDIGLATTLGREFDVPMEIAHVVEQRIIEAYQKGCSTTKVQEMHAGIDILF